MNIKTTTTVEISNAAGEELVSISRTERFHVLDNPRFLISESMFAVTANAETALVNAGSALDRAKSKEQDA